MFVKPRLSTEVYSPIGLPSIKPLTCRSPSKPQIEKHNFTSRRATRASTEASLADLLQIKQHKIFDKASTSSRTPTSKGSLQTALSKSPSSASNAQTEKQPKHDVSLLEDDNLSECSQEEIDHDHYFGGSRMQTLADQGGECSIMFTARSPSKIGNNIEATFLCTEDSVCQDLSGFMRTELGGVAECSFLNQTTVASRLLDDSSLIYDPRK